MSQPLIKLLYTVEKVDLWAIDLLCDAFEAAPRLQNLLNVNRKGYLHRLRRLLSWVYFRAKRMGGVLTTEDHNTLVLYYQHRRHSFSLSDILFFICILVGDIGLVNGWRMRRQERLIREARQAEIEAQQDEDFLYVWFLAREPHVKGLQGLVEMEMKLLALAQALQVPIYLETAHLSLLKLYRRMGFRFFKELVIEEGAMTLWFGRCPPPGQEA